jgi:ATP/maltotriose-dependent transcriptional regulator MalT
VLALIARGLTNREIAVELDIGDESVKTYLERLFTKLGVKNRTEAVDAGHRLGLLGR